MTEIPALPIRASSAHKGDFGRVLIVAGCRQMSGAAVLTSTACLNSGAGLVTVATSESAQPLVAVGHPSVMTMGWPETPAGMLALDSLKILKQTLPGFDVVAFGPGLGRSLAVDRIAGWLYRDSPCPVVIDADGLNGLAIELNLGNLLQGNSHGPRVLTPHPGEMQRLWEAAREVGWVADAFASSADRAIQESQVKRLASMLQSTILFKGQNTYVTDGQSEFRNRTGNPGLATAGSGDTLTGIISAMIPVMPSVFEATVLSAHIHGMAGDLAAAELGQVGMTSKDLLRYLPQAWQSENTKL